MGIGAIVRSLREERGLTQRELADKAGLRQSYLSRLESGTRSSRPDTLALARIAQALDVTMEEILSKAGLWPSPDPHLDSDPRWKRIERAFRSMPEERQEELLAIAHVLMHLRPARKPAAGAKGTLVPRVIGQSEDPAPVAKRL